MKLTHFRKFLNAVSTLDPYLVENQIIEVKALLGGRGQLVNRDTTVITEEGIFYIDPRSGLATKVALYGATIHFPAGDFEMREVGAEGYEEPEVIERLPQYHILRCNTLTQYEMQGYPEGTRIVQRSDGGFYTHVSTMMGRRNPEEVYQDLENQRLPICKNCLVKMNSLIEGLNVFTVRSFRIQDFFDAGFQATWCNRGQYSKERGAFADIYPKDWLAIAALRKEQAQYICEDCDADLSDPHHRGRTFIHSSDHRSGKISYSKLRCVCEVCAQEHARVRSGPSSMPNEPVR